jgi:phosphoserine phosphatase RsbU/P
VSTSGIKDNEQNILLERLSLQAESFQEGFEVLLKSRNLKDMVNTFAHLLRGNFVIKDSQFYYKDKKGSEWEEIFYLNNTLVNGIEYLNGSDSFRIQYINDTSTSASVILPLADSSILGILIGKKLDGSGLTVADKITLQIMLQVFSSAYKVFHSQKKIKKLIFDLNEKVFQLNNLVDSGIELSRFEKRSNLFQVALEKVSSITNSSSALIRITSSEGEQFYVFPEGTAPDDILKSNYKIESSFSLAGSEYSVVLSAKETREGETHFNDLDKTLLEAITRQISASLENDFWHKQSLEKEKMQKELNVAADIQQQILPKNLPQIHGYELAAVNIPSMEVGGDYYDCINLGNNRFAFIIADVAGKGIGAALLVNTLSAALYSYLDFNLPVAEMSDKLNKLIYKASPPDKYITFFMAILDAETGKLELVNAGHNPILLLKNDGRLEQISAGGVGLGMFDFGIPYNGQTIEMAAGDKLFLYTDGIPEAMNQDEVEYSDEKMIKFFTENCSKDSQEFVDLLVNDVRLHCSGQPQSDDITMMLLKKT